MTRVCLLLFACLVAATGCSNNNPVTTPTPTTPTIFTEVFSGTINMNGAASHSFVSQTSGGVRITLTRLTPDPAQIVGLSLGTWTGSACQVVIAADRASQQSSITGSVGATGSLCARVYDVGTIASGAPVSYEITVEHP
jgi:hypothetical protein